MDETLQALLGAIAGAVVAGGAAIAWFISERQRVRSIPVTTSAVPPGVADVLSVLRSSAVVLGEDDTVLKASAPAYALGVVRGQTLVNHDLLEAVHSVRRDGEIRDVDTVAIQGIAGQRFLTARVAPLGARLILVLVEDRTRERRVEATRRDFVANVSHELKTPVGAIRLLAEATADASDDPEAVHRFTGRMLVESDRLSRLVQQIIELSRLQGDEPITSASSVQADQIVTAAIDTSITDAEAKKIRLLSGGESGLTLLGNPAQLTAAVSNLVANAVAYSGEGASVTVTTKAGDEDTVEISVVDQGIGIPSPELDRIFERFYRVDPARHRSTGGTGLGLSIVKHVVATHGGDVRVWSAEGQGSTFTLVLPAATPSGARRRQEASA